MHSPSRPAASFIVRHRVPLGVLGGLLLVGGILTWRFVQRWDQFLESKVRPWAEAEVLRMSDGAYALRMGTLAFSAFPGRIAIDTLRITTDSARNQRRPRPLADVTALVVDCELRGINTWQLIKRGGLSASRFTCTKIDVVADLPALAATKPHPAATPVPKHAFLAPEESIRLPPLIPLVEVDRLELPLISLDINRHGKSADQRIHVSRLFADIRGTRIVSGEAAGTRTLFSDHVEVGGQGLSFRTGSGADETAVVLGGLRINLTDSVIALQGFRVGPALDDAAWRARQRVRKDLVRFALDSGTLAGLDFVALTGPEGRIGLRHVALHGLVLDVRTDLALPVAARRNATPQELARGLHRQLAVDTILVRGGAIRYHEHAVGKPTSGLASFTELSAHVTNLRTIARGHGPVPPLVIDANARLFGAGRLHAIITLPLTAPGFDMTYRGTLGPMEFSALNSFVARNMPAEVKAGTVHGVTFSAVARNGHATGTITPLYNGLQVELLDPKAGGLGRLGLRILSAAANEIKVRQNNPEKEGKAPRLGTINHQFVRSESLIQFLWFAIRDALLPVLSR